MKMDLSSISEQLALTYNEEAVNEDVDADEGEEVGEVGKKDGEVMVKKAGGKKRKVKVGRGLGVGDLVERNESK